MVVIEAPALTLLEAEAPHNECGLKIEVSTPPFSMEVVIHLEAVLEDISLYGALEEINSSFVFSCLISLVFPMYTRHALTGHILAMF